jgi:hypothetical protein
MRDIEGLFSEWRSCVHSASTLPGLGLGLGTVWSFAEVETVRCTLSVRASTRSRVHHTFVTPILLAREGPAPALRLAIPGPGALALRFLLKISCARASFLRRLRSVRGG